MESIRLSFCRIFPSTLLALSLVSTGTEARADLGGTQPGEVPAAGFVDADYCGQCHGGGLEGDYNFLPSDTWAGTMMANAARDPVFFAALTIANQDEPGIGTYCLRCHTPLGFVRGHATPPDGSLLDTVDLQGVGCDVCHRATQSTGMNAPYLLGDAQLVFTADTSKHGPYEGASSPVHDTVQDSGLSDARFCGQCHYVTNPGRRLRDAKGVETSIEFPLDTTFLEWASSTYADVAAEGHATCQDCHMKPKIGEWPVSDEPTAPLRTDPRRHELVGGNVWGIDAVMAKNPDRAAYYKKAFSGARARAEKMLHTSVALTVLDAPARVRRGDTLEVKVRVENLSGHKFPTGYAEARRAWVALTLVDEDFVKRTLVGAYDATTGEVAMEPPTHMYRAQHGRWNGSAPEAEEHLANHDMILSDTRIPPKGFVPTETTKPTGEIDFSDGAGGYRHTDELTLRAVVPTELSGHQALVVQVLYQSMTREHVEMLANENVTDDRGKELLAIYEATGQAAPIAAATVMQGLEIDPAASEMPAVEDTSCGVSRASREAGAGIFWFAAAGAYWVRRRRAASC